MSTSIFLLDQNLNANDVVIIVFEPFVLLPPAAALVKNRNFQKLEI